MTKILSIVALLLSFATEQAKSFGVQPLHRAATSRHSSCTLFSSAEDEQQPQGEPSKRLIFDADKVQEQMNKLKSKYPTQEADYLAAARKRAEMKVESVNDQSTDDDWKQVAEEQRKQKGGAAKDDWEASLKEAGNEDSQILIPIELDDDDDGEPKLLL